MASAEEEEGVTVPELSRAHTARSRALRTVLLEEASRPFDIMKGPLLRIRLYSISPREHVLLIAMHHTATDGWSTSVLLRELSAAYNAFHAGVAPSLPPLPIQYADFASWQRHWLSQGPMANQVCPSIRFLYLSLLCHAQPGKTALNLATA